MLTPNLVNPPRLLGLAVFEHLLKNPNFQIMLLAVIVKTTNNTNKLCLEIS